MNATKSTVLSLSLISLSLPAIAVGQSATDPLYQSKGDQKRSYKFAPTGEMLPYRIYVPMSWKQGEKLPLVLVLHGGGLDQNAPFDRSPAPMKDELQKLAEEFRFIVVSPMGYNMSGGFGAPPPAGAPGGPPMPANPRPATAEAMPPARPMPAMPAKGPHDSEYSQQDVMNVVALVEKEYGADTTKEFVTGNSMGAIGTMWIAAQYPDKWVAMAPSEGGYDPVKYGKDHFGVKGALLIHKEDPKAPQVETGSAAMVKVLVDEGVNAHTISVPNTAHENVWFFTLPTTFHFFDQYVHPPAQRPGPPPAK